ncbi:hypothetical protein [Nocardia flavorosea]|uniref:hypothetical protein n=1 Tax=Nocardia flavorosea TaxID=53429 RepID=UPI0024540796|nr:hypothetical protein [Nocardia flavorosea]
MDDEQRRRRDIEHAHEEQRKRSERARKNNDQGRWFTLGMAEMRGETRHTGWQREQPMKLPSGRERKHDNARVVNELGGRDFTEYKSGDNVGGHSKQRVQEAAQRAVEAQERLRQEQEREHKQRETQELALKRQREAAERTAESARRARAAAARGQREPLTRQEIADILAVSRPTPGIDPIHRYPPTRTRRGIDPRTRGRDRGRDLER